MNARWLLPVSTLALGFAIPTLLRPKVPSAESPSTAEAHESKDAGTRRDASPGEAAAPGGARHAYDFTALSATGAYSSQLHRLAAAARYFQSMEPTEFPRAFADLKERPMDENGSLRQLFSIWASFAPAEALHYAQMLAGPVRSGAIYSIFTVWATEHLDEAAKAKAALSSEDQEPADAALQGLKRYAERLEPPKISGRDAFWKSVTMREDGLGGWGGETKPAFQRWLREDLTGAAREVSGSVIVNNGGDFTGMIYEALLQKDPAEAKRFLDGLSPRARQEMALKRLPMLARQDFAAARSLAEGAPTPAARAELLGKLGDVMFEANPTAAIDLLKTMPEDLRRERYPKHLAWQWLQTEPEQAAEWLLADPAFQNELASHEHGEFFQNEYVLKPWVEKDPLAAATFAARLPEAELPSVMYAVGKIWMQHDPSGALRWAAAQPGGSPPQVNALREFSFWWSQKDPKAAAAFATALPPGEGKSGAAVGLTYGLFDTDADAALAWARSVSGKNPALLGNAWSKWHSNNPTAADRWRDGSRALTEAERQTLH